MVASSPIRKSDMPETRHEVLKQRFENHIEDYRRHVDEDHLKWEEIGKVTKDLVSLTEANTAAIQSTNAVVIALAESTKGLVDLQTTGRTIAAIGVWLKNTMIFGAIAVYIYTTFVV